MPVLTSPGTFIPGGQLNTVNSPSSTGQGNLVDGSPTPSGLAPGKSITVTTKEALGLSNTTVGTLYEGEYQYVYVDPLATPANVATGRIAYIKQYAGVAGRQYAVTDGAHADSVNLVAGVFLNAVTPGNYGFLFTGRGRVNVTYLAALTNATPAIGDQIVAGDTTGKANDASATAVSALTFGVATVLPAANATSTVKVALSYTRP